MKSKRSLSGRTAEPACLTWSPSTSRSAACSRCVAVWFAIVGKRAAHATTARTRLPAPMGRLARPSRRASTWSSPNFSTSTTSSRASVAVEHEVAGVAHLAAARGVERRSLELDELPRADRPADGEHGGQHLGLLVADELARRRAGARRSRRRAARSCSRRRRARSRGGSPSARGSRRRRPPGRAPRRAPTVSSIGKP